MGEGAKAKTVLWKDGGRQKSERHNTLWIRLGGCRRKVKEKEKKKVEERKWERKKEKSSFYRKMQGKEG